MSDSLDPTKVQSDILSKIMINSEGDSVPVNYNTPLANLTEATSFAVSNAVNHISRMHSRRFINNSTNREDLYPHLSDKHLMFAFANPSSASFTFYFDLSYLKVNAVKVPGTTYKKLFFPKYTTIIIEEVEFILPTAINFILLSNGSIRLEYDLREPSNLEIISQNTIPWEIANYEGIELFQFSIPMLQLKRRSFKEIASPNRTFIQEFTTVDQFHYCNVYSWVNGSKKKLTTTLTQEVKDINKPTAILTILENSIKVEIPLIYFSKGLVGNDIEIELFVTKGNFTLDMSKFNVDNFSLRYGDSYFDVTDGNFFNPLSRMSSMGIYSTDVSIGGLDLPTFEQLKEYVVYGVDKVEPPVNQNQLRNLFERNGYSFSTEKDTLLERIFVASKDLPRDTTNEFNTGISCGITPITVTAQNLVSIIDTVCDNDQRVTLLPGTIINVDGLPEIVPNTNLPRNITDSNSSLANEVNSNNYVYNPFHYVIDMSMDRLEVRPYYLKPRVSGRQAVAINSLSQYSMSTLSTEFKMSDSGFSLFLDVKLSTNITNDRLFAQLSFVPVDDYVPVYLAGELLKVEDNVARFKFNLESNFDIDRYNGLFINSFSNFTGNRVSVKTSLENSFNLIYGMTDNDNYISSDIDNQMNPNLISGLPISLTHELIKLEFGIHLSNLWSKSKNVAGSLEYDYYEEDSPYLYEETIPERVDGKIVFETVDGKPRPKILHHKGDPLIVDGELQYRYRAGTVKRDPVTKNPLFKSPNRTTERNIQLFTMDANYLYSSAPSDIKYKDFIIETVVSICTKDLASIVPDQGENTKVLFYPTNSVGTVAIIDNNSQEIKMDSNISFEVTVYMTDEAFKNSVLRTSLEKGIKRIISENLSLKTIAMSLIEKQIKESFSTDIISVNVESDFSKEGIDIISTVEDSSKLTIRRKLGLLEDNSLFVKDDVYIVAKVHS